MLLQVHAARARCARHARATLSSLSLSLARDYVARAKPERETRRIVTPPRRATWKLFSATSRLAS